MAQVRIDDLDDYDGTLTDDDEAIISQDASGAAFKVKLSDLKDYLAPASPTESPPTIIQTANSAAAVSRPTTETVTFGANTTVGSTIVFICVAGANYGTTAPYSNAATLLTLAKSRRIGERLMTLINEQITVLVLKVETPATVYTINVGSSNSPVRIYALECATLSRVDYRAFKQSVLSTTHLTGYLPCKPGPYNILVASTDTDSQALVAYTSGLTLLLSSHGAGASQGGNVLNHAGYFFHIGDTLCGKGYDIQTTANPSTTLSLGAVIRLVA